MKRITTILFATILTLLAFTPAKAQLWLMTDGGVFFSKSIVGYGPNVRAAWHFGDYDINMVTFGGGFNMLASSKVDLILEDTLGNTDTLESTLSANVITIDADYRRYFAGSDADDYYAFYGIAGVSMWMVGTKVANVTPEDTTFALREGTKLVGMYPAVRIPLGVGFDWTIRGRLWWYVEAKMGIPITQVNDPWIGNEFGVSFQFNTGARFLLWDLY